MRFDKPCHALQGAVEYFREHLRVGDYLTEQGKVEMSWFGEGTNLLGLVGGCDLETFRRLCEGRHPWSDERLGVRQKSNRRLCYFGQISAPKDVSIAYLVGGDQRIANWWNEAVRETLHEIEATMATRVRKKGENSDRVTGNMVAAMVTHDASRALDPQLHTHLCIMNLTWDAAERRWKGVQPSGFYRHPGYFREVCYNKLAGRMLAGGYRLESARGVGFNLVGFPADLRTRFSKRREQILRLAQQAGVSSQAELQAITAKSRASKTQATASDLREGWLREAGSCLKPLRRMVATATMRHPPVEEVLPSDSLASAEAHVFERRAVVDERVLLREALVHGRGRLSLTGLKEGLVDRVGSGDLLKHGALMGSPDAMRCEQEFLDWAEKHRDACRSLGTQPVAPSNDGAARVVAGILASSSRVVILQGDAGTGKTTCLKTIVANIQAGGSDVFGCAPTTGAAEVLRAELTPSADTLQQLLVNSTLQASVRGRVIIVDEAGLISSRQMRDLCRLAETNNNRLLLVGDTKQHSSVEAGDALRCLQQYANTPVFRLTKIHRQKDPAYREAVALLAAGKAQAGFDAFAQLGAIVEIPDSPDLLRTAAEDYVHTITSGKSCLAISPVWSEIHAFGAEVRTNLKSTNQIMGPEVMIPTLNSMQWTREERRRLSGYEPGDVLTFRRATSAFEGGESVVVVRREADALLIRSESGRERRFDPRMSDQFDVGTIREIAVAVGDRLLIRANRRQSRLKNGDIVEVAEITPTGKITLTDGRIIPLNFRQFSHGYATTSHAAQGKTVQCGLLFMADAGIASANLKQAYVSNSRFVETQKIYTTDRVAARAAIARSGDRLLAMEMEPSLETATSARRSFLAELYSQGSPSGTDMLRGWSDGISTTGASLGTIGSG